MEIDSFVNQEVSVEERRENLEKLLENVPEVNDDKTLRNDQVLAGKRNMLLLNNFLGFKFITFELFVLLNCKLVIHFNAHCNTSKLQLFWNDSFLLMSILFEMHRLRNNILLRVFQ